MKNTWGKSHKVADPQGSYYKVTSCGWTWYVLKCWGDPRKPYARAFCRVVTPMTGSRGDLGDVYTADIPGLIEAWTIDHLLQSR